MSTSCEAEQTPTFSLIRMQWLGDTEVKNKNKLNQKYHYSLIFLQQRT
jgi:hypothetical protein